MLHDEFSGAAESNTFIKQAFEGEYPKLLRLYNELWKRLRAFNSNFSPNLQSTTFQPDDMVNADGNDVMIQASAKEFDAELMLRESLSPFENAYLSRSLSRLFDPINLVFSAGSVSAPTLEEIEGISKTISSELNVASVDFQLSVTVSKNVAKTIQLFAVKCEQLLSTDGEASQVIGVVTAGQRRNTAVVNSLYQLHQHITKVLSNLTVSYPQNAVEAIQIAMEDIVVLMGNAIAPLISSINDSLEAIILTMHSEDFSNTTPPPANAEAEAQCSLYMKELQQFIMRAQAMYFSEFECREFILDSLHPVACQCIEKFVRHASLVRPLAEGGKMKLAADFAQMEMAISPLCYRVSDLGKPYRLLRASRPLLFQTTEHAAANPAIGDIIPYSVIIHFLFGRAPPELKSPHQAVSWSLSRYSQWLDDHQTEKDRLQFIKGSLESYVQSVTAKEEKEFASVYPIMLDLLQRGLSSI